MLNMMEIVKKKISTITQTVKSKISVLERFLPFFSFVIPFLILYYLDPESFGKTWKGRTYYLFFLWLFCLETILNWNEIKARKISKIKSVRTITFIITLVIPTVYVIVANFYGLNHVIEELARQSNIFWATVMPLSTEYLIFTVVFALIILLAYGINGLGNYSITIFFLGIIGIVYTIDNVYPQGTFTPFQIVVPTTAKLAANVLNLMGYQTRFLPPVNGMPTFYAWNSQGAWGASIAWPCSGVESLLIYTVMILLFLKKTIIPWKHRIAYFIIGAIVTYFINVLRIATIFVIGINEGNTAAQHFHNYYGQLYSITWILSYPLIIIGSQILWTKIRNWRTSTKDNLKKES